MERTEAQWKQILAYMRSGRSLTMYEMLIKFGCGNHKGRIYDIREKGHDVDGKMVELSNGKCVKRYFMPEFYKGD